MSPLAAGPHLRMRQFDLAVRRDVHAMRGSSPTVLNTVSRNCAEPPASSHAAGEFAPEVDNAPPFMLTRTRVLHLARRARYRPAS